MGDKRPNKWPKFTYKLPNDSFGGYFSVSYHEHMTILMTKYATKLMTSRQAINDQTIYDHIFVCVNRDWKLATNDRQIKSGRLYVDCGHFFVTYLSLCTSAS